MRIGIHLKNKNFVKNYLLNCVWLFAEPYFFGGSGSRGPGADYGSDQQKYRLRLSKKDCLKVKNLKTFYKITIISYYQIPCIFSVVDFHFSLLNPDPHIECVPVHPDSHYVTLWKRFETRSA